MLSQFTERNRFVGRVQSDFQEMAHSWSEESEFVTSAVRVDLEDKDGEFPLTAELPRFEKDDVEVLVPDRTLGLKAEHTEETEEAEEEYFLRERLVHWSPCRSPSRKQ